MKLYIADCDSCRWTAEKTTRPDARELADSHESECVGRCEVSLYDE